MSPKSGGILRYKTVKFDVQQQYDYKTEWWKLNIRCKGRQYLALLYYRKHYSIQMDICYNKEIQSGFSNYSERFGDERLSCA